MQFIFFEPIVNSRLILCLVGIFYDVRIDVHPSLGKTRFLVFDQCSECFLLKLKTALYLGIN